MFYKNLQALNITNQKLAFELKKIEIEETQKIVSAHYSTSKNYILALNNVPLDDINNPIEDSNNIFKNNIDANLKNNDFIIIFGFGFGYLPQQAFINSKSNIFIYEPNIHVLRFVLNFVDFSNVLSNQKIFLTNNINEIYEKLFKKYLNKNKINILVNKSYMTLYSKNLTEFTQKIIDTTKSKQNDYATIKKNSKTWVNNIINNLQIMEKTRPTKYFENIFENKTVIILSAGPSLKNDIEIIKKYQNNLYIIAINKILPFLLQEKIIPDFVILADGCDVNSFNNNLIEIENLNFILNIKSLNKFFSMNTNSKMIYFPNNSTFIETLLNSNKNLITENTSSTTSIYAFEMAKLMGFKNIIFSGLDLALKKNIVYATGQEHNAIDKTYYGSKYELVNIKNFKSENIKTRYDYAVFIKQFEDLLNEKPFENLYNTTDFGAYINGMQYKKLNELTTLFKNQEKQNINNIISEIFLKTTQEWNTTCNNIKNNYNTIKEKAKQIDLNYTNEFETLVNENKITYPFPYINISKQFISKLSLIMQNQILSEYFQIEVLDYTDKLENSIINNKEDFTNHITQEKLFIENIKKYINQM